MRRPPAFALASRTAGLRSVAETEEWAFGTVHTTKPSVGNNDLGYPVCPEAAGPRLSMQSTVNNAEITPEDYSGSSVILAVISTIE